jgi:hypothetical protein
MTQDFETYLQQARTEFCLVAHKYNVTEHNELRTAIDSLLVAYDQAFLALRKHGVMQSEGSDGAEGAAVGQRSGGKSVCVECEAPAGRAISVGFRRNCIQRFGYLCPCRNRSTKFN